MRNVRSTCGSMVRVDGTAHLAEFFPRPRYADEYHSSPWFCPSGRQPATIQQAECWTSRLQAGPPQRTSKNCRQPGWESNPLGGLILRKLLILRNSKMEKNCKNAEVRYTAGTRPDSEIRPHGPSL